MMLIPWRRRTRPPVACGVLAALPAATPAPAQDTGTVSGTIVDASGQVVPGAAVTLTSDATASARTLPSDERGEFAFRAVTPGSHTVNVELTGFRSIEHRNNVLNASGRLDVGRQIRAGIYNLFNQVEFQDIDRTARFDAGGVQINPNFGTPIGITNPTRPPRVVQLSVRLNF